jgi:signal transduction histidine kinase
MSASVAEQALSRRLQRKDEFLAMLAHELRNPLAGIGNAIVLIEHTCARDSRRTRKSAGRPASSRVRSISWHDGRRL